MPKIYKAILVPIELQRKIKALARKKGKTIIRLLEETFNK